MKLRISEFFPMALPAILLAVISLWPNISEARSEYWRQRVSLFEALPIERGDIVFLGNSLTDGGEWTELFNDPKIKNRGINSDEISGVKERLSQITDNSPSKIFLLIGINDISHGDSLDSLSSEYESLVKEIRRRCPDTELYLQSILPINNDFRRYKNLFGKEGMVDGLNKSIKSIAADNGAEFIDLFPALSEPASGKLRTEFTNDGLHLLGPGYLAWAEAIRDYVIK